MEGSLQNSKPTAGLDNGFGAKLRNNEKYSNKTSNACISHPPSKMRSLSGPDLKTYSPPSESKETEKHVFQDNSAIDNIPLTPRRNGPRQRGLSLKMPLCESSEIFPSSPRSDQSQKFGFPTCVLPRRSRGLDFSRAATNLHHSTLAEQSSPESSPTVACRGAINIPSRTNNLNMTEGYDFLTNSGLQGSKTSNTDRINPSSSLGSVRIMAGSDSSDNCSNEDELMDDIDDSILTTLDHDDRELSWSAQLAGSSSAIKFRRLKPRSRKNRNILSNGSSNRTLSPLANSPPIFHNLEGLTRDLNKEGSSDIHHLRRGSLSWEANQLRISGNENDDGISKQIPDNIESSPITPGREGHRGVVRRPVTRRGNMLPKTKGFARIQAALAEEVTPVETEVRREAELVRQTRENENDLEPRQNHTTSSSPSLKAELEIPSGILCDLKQQLVLGSTFKNTLPQLQNCTNAFSNIDEMSLGSPLTYSGPLFDQSTDNRSSSPTQSDTPQPGPGPTAAEIAQKLNKKRRRNDFDLTSFKRRAVSPSVSTHNSPVVQSPMQRDYTLWGSRTPTNSGHSESGKSSINTPAKRIGLQGIVETNDGLMKMSIE